MTKVRNRTQKNGQASFGRGVLYKSVMSPNTRGVYIVREFKEEPLYKQSAGRILVYGSEKKDTDIVFRRPPKEQPAFKSEEGVVRNVFKK